MNGISAYLKGHIAVLSAIGVALQVAYPHAHWAPAVSSFVGALLVYLVPNSPKVPPAPSGPTSSMGTNS